jgi:hypothetical protein
MTEGFAHPAHLAADNLLAQAELARREGKTRAAHVFERAAALQEARAARETSNPTDRALLWSSAVAFAFHAQDQALVDELALEALSQPIDPRAAREIRTLVEAAQPAKQPTIITRSKEFRAKLRDANQERDAA